MLFVVLEHLLWALLVDVGELMLRLPPVVPDNISKPRLLACLRVRALLDCLDVVDVVFPRTWGRRPFFLLLDALCRRGSGCIVRVHSRFTTFALLALTGFGFAAYFLPIFVQYFLCA
jgi:hypothetical protein